MKIEFTLSFDEFLEANKPAPPRTEINSGTALAISGLLLGGISGLSFLGTNHAGARVGLVLSGLLLVAAPFVGRFASLWASRAQQERLRFTHRCYYSDLRLFEADEQGWRFASMWGNTTHAWSELRWWSEKPGHFALISLGYVYTLPKRAFSPEQAKTLRGYLRRAMEESAGKKLFTLDYRVSALDYFQATRTHFWSSNFLNLVLAYLTGAGLIVFFVIRATSGELFEQGPNLLAAGAVLAALLGFECVHLPLWARDKDVLLPVQAVFFEHGVHTSYPKGNALFRFRFAYKVKETRGQILVYQDADHFFIFPKRFFSPEQVGQLRNALLDSQALRR